MSTLFRGGAASLRALLMPAAFLLAFPSIAAGQPSGQTRQPLTISVPSVFQVEPSTETPMVIRVMPEKAVPRQVMVLIRGLPSTVALSEGRLFDSGVWAIRVADLPGLRVASPATSGERSQLVISVVSLDGSVLAEAATTLLVAAPQAVAKAEPAAKSNTQLTTAIISRKAEENPPAPAPVKKALTPEEMQRVEMFMAKAEENMQTGNVNVARLFYKRAADMGWPPGALALASTYDTAELERMGTVGGIQPDTQLAKQWYEKARELGAPEAQQRLSRLTAR